MITTAGNCPSPAGRARYPKTVPASPGNSTIIQADYTAITTTHPRPGSSRPTIVDSDAYVTACLDLPENVGCSSDGVPGNGFAINDARYLGKLEGSLTYRIRLRTAGTYQIGCLAGVFDNTPPAQIALVAAGRTYLTPVTPGGYRMSWSADQITLPAGEQTIQIQVPPGYGGWALNSFVLRRS